jgi:hypothetical protein
MHPISDKELDKLFQQRFGDLEIEPSEAVWGKITGTMDQKSKKYSPGFWMAAASVITLISASLWFFRPVEVIRLQGNAEMGQIIEESTKNPVVAEALPVQNEPVNDADITHPELTDFTLANAAGIKPNEYQLIEQIPSPEPETKLPAVQEPVLIAATPVKKNIPAQPKPEVKVPRRYSGDQSGLDVTQPDMMAKVDLPEEEINPDENENRGQKRIRSIGGLVNFVIAKVDKREDKLIEFKDGVEGSEVSGINLGLVKIKSRK